MFKIYYKSISSGKVEELTAHSPMLATSYEEAMLEFTELVREWLSNDDMSFYWTKPDIDELYTQPGDFDGSFYQGDGWYNESNQPILMDGDSISKYNDGNNKYYIEEVK